MNDKVNGRFKDAPWYKQCENEDILLGGVGGIGSNALYYLAIVTGMRQGELLGLQWKNVDIDRGIIK